MAGVCHAPMVSVRSIMRSGVLSIISKIPEISVGIQMERSVLVSSDRNIRDRLCMEVVHMGAYHLSE